MGNRVPPNDMEAERAVLGGCIVDHRYIDVVAEHLAPEDWYSEAHQRMWVVMLELMRRGVAVDEMTLRHELQRREELQRVGGDEYLMAITESAMPIAKHLEDYAAIIRDLSHVRNLITACHEVAARGYGKIEDVQAFLDDAEAQVFRASAARHLSTSCTEHVAEVLHQEVPAIEAACDRGEGLRGIPTGLSGLNRKMAGFHPGELVLVGGRPSMGKSALAGHFLMSVAEAGHAALAFSCEMPKAQYVRRMICARGHIDAGRMRHGTLHVEERAKVPTVAAELAEMPIHIDDTPGISIHAIRSKARRVRSQCGALGLVVVDYLQLCTSGAKLERRELEVAEMSKALKELALELDCTVVALSQLNRTLETRSDKRPMLSDLRESGSLEQDADAVLFVYRDEVYNKKTDDQGIAEVIVGKQRSGPIGTIRLRFFGEYTSFYDLADDFQDVPEQQPLYGKEAAAGG